MFNVNLLKKDTGSSQFWVGEYGQQGSRITQLGKIRCRLYSFHLYKIFTIYKTKVLETVAKIESDAKGDGGSPRVRLCGCSCYRDQKHYF